jgi:hypothetical protein
MWARNVSVQYSEFVTIFRMAADAADPDPGSGAFLTPGSRIPDPKPIILRAW